MCKPATILTNRTGGASPGSGYPPVGFSFEDFLDAIGDSNVIPADIALCHALYTYVGYQHLSAYLGFIKTATSDASAVSLSCLVEFMQLDAMLRIEILRAVDVLEHAIKAQWAQASFEFAGTLAYRDSSLFSNQQRHASTLAHIDNEVYRQARTSGPIKAALRKGPDAVPVWVAIDCATLGSVSQLFSNSSPEQITTSVSNAFKCSKRELTSWLHTLTAVRNICSHFDRFIVRPRLPIVPLRIIGNEEDATAPLYAVLLLSHLLHSCGEREYTPALSAEQQLIIAATTALNNFSAHWPAISASITIPRCFARSTPV